MEIKKAKIERDILGADEDNPKEGEEGTGIMNSTGDVTNVGGVSYNICICMFGDIYLFAIECTASAYL